MISIKAKFVHESKTALYLNCEGDKIWVPKSLVNFDAEKESLELPEWLHKQKFPNEPV